MKYLVLLLSLLVYSSSSMAAAKRTAASKARETRSGFFVKLGDPTHGQAVGFSLIRLEQNKSFVYLLETYTDSGAPVRQVLPKSLFTSLMSETKNWKKRMLAMTPNTATPICRDVVEALSNERSQLYCADLWKQKPRKNFFTWLASVEKWNE